jgi:carbonic anhydrase/acetyltransferase-like protein (isoleucine patch superfamily)
VLYEEIPCQTGILRDLCVVGRNSVVDIGALVVSSFDEQSLVASEGKTGGKGTVR